MARWWAAALLVEPCDFLVGCEHGGVLDAVGEKVVDLCKTEVLAIVVRLRHFI